VRRLRAKARWVKDDTFIRDAATDALLAYAEEPAKFDGAKSSLMTYLTWAAYRDLQNMLSKEERRNWRRVPFEDVEYSLADGNSIEEEFEGELMEQYGITTPEEKAAFRTRVVEAFPDPLDRQLLNLMLRDERKTSVYSSVLEIQGLEQKEQQRIVKRHKDRITKRLQRLRGKLREPRQQH
jgi:RNA polymerase sigma-70 factor (ECF subfamily)